MAVTRRAPIARCDSLRRKGAEVVTVRSCGRRVDISTLARVLAGRGVRSVLMEGGGELNASALRAGIVNKLVVFVGPKIIGGRGAPTLVGGLGTASLSGAVPLSGMKVTQCGVDLVIEAYVGPEEDCGRC